MVLFHCRWLHHHFIAYIHSNLHTHSHWFQLVGHVVLHVHNNCVLVLCVWCVVCCKPTCFFFAQINIRVLKSRYEYNTGCGCALISLSESMLLVEMDGIGINIFRSTAGTVLLMYYIVQGMWLCMCSMALSVWHLAQAGPKMQTENNSSPKSRSRWTIFLEKAMGNDSTSQTPCAHRKHPLCIQCNTYTLLT